jgi:two-component system nitrate/nitrite sensor histidine kinase NarX
LDRRAKGQVASGWTNVHRLRWIGVILPVAFIGTLELIRFTVVETDMTRQAGHIALAATTILAVVAFAILMFFFIERAQRQVIRQNRELAAVNAVSTAVQGELGVDVIIDAALASVIESTGATEAGVTVFAPEGQPSGEGGLERRLVAAEHPSPRPAMGAAVPHLIDIPLSTGSSVVGRMRLHLPEGATEPDLLTTATLQNIGHQLACSIQIGQLFGDLQRRQREGHGTYDVLLQISNQHALADILAAVVSHARRLLGSDEAVMCLNNATSRSVQLDGTLAGTASLGDGSVCVSADADRFHDLHEGQVACPVRSSPVYRASLEVPIRSPEGSLGDLWIGRTADIPYTERDRRFLVTLSDLASIAITGARMRENERQGAILAERERIAREMHDSLAQVLGVTHLRLRALGTRAGVLPAPQVTTEMLELADLAEEAYRDVREAILGLRESSRVDRGFIDSLHAYLDKFSHQSGVRVTLETALDRELALSPRAEVQVIRVIQEALTNVRKHSGASAAVVRITDANGGTTIVVEDNGHGFDLNSALLGRDGFGLHTMRERVELIGGTLTIDSSPGRGTRVIALMPGAASAAASAFEVNGAADSAHPDPAGR